jgi:hypothetical protein
VYWRVMFGVIWVMVCVMGVILHVSRELQCALWSYVVHWGSYVRCYLGYVVRYGGYSAC